MAGPSKRNLSLNSTSQCAWLALLILSVLPGTWCVSRTLLATSKGKAFFFPLERREPQHLRRTLMMRSGGIRTLGAVRDGYFYTTLYLGTPPQPFDLIIDTGSTMTYVPCSNCKQCGKHKGLPFNPELSSTFEPIHCSDSRCFCGNPSCTCDNGKCYYARHYAERSSSAGWLVQDMYSFPDNGTAVPVSFGCSNLETGEIYKQAADGLLGMGHNVNAFHNQLAASGVIDPVFSLCFGFPSGGGMFLGDVDLPPEIDLRYTPLVDTGYHYYNLRLDGIQIAGQPIDVNPQVYTEGYGTVMDSGTTFTYLPTPAYQAILEQITSYVKDKGPVRFINSDSGFDDICWRGVSDSLEELAGAFPVVQLMFADDVPLRLLPHRYLFRGGNNVYCLGVFDNQNQGTLIGSITVRDVLVQYDVLRKRVGFAEVDCRTLGMALPDGNPQNYRGPAVREMPETIKFSTQTNEHTAQGGGASVQMEEYPASMPSRAQSHIYFWGALLTGGLLLTVVVEKVYNRRDDLVSGVTSRWQQWRRPYNQMEVGDDGDDDETSCLTQIDLIERQPVVVAKDEVVRLKSSGPL